MKRLHWLLLFLVGSGLFLLPLAWTSPSFWILQGDYFSRHQSWTQALTDYERARQEAPEDWRAPVRAAMVYGKLGRPKDEEAAYRLALSLSERPEVLLPWAQSCMAQGRLEQAKELLQRALANHFAPMETRFLMGQIYLSLRQKEKARRWWASILEINPHCSFALGGLAFLAQQDEDWVKAADYFERAATATPEVSQEVLLNAATCYLKIDRKPDALRCLRQANTFSPGGLWAPALLLQAHTLKKRSPEYQLILAQLSQMRLAPDQRQDLSSLKS